MLECCAYVVFLLKWLPRGNPTASASLTRWVGTFVTISDLETSKPALVLTVCVSVELM